MYDLGKRGCTFPDRVLHDDFDNPFRFVWKRNTMEITCDVIDENHIELIMEQNEEIVKRENLDLSDKMYYAVKLIWDHE